MLAALPNESIFGVDPIVIVELPVQCPGYVRFPHQQSSNIQVEDGDSFRPDGLENGIDSHSVVLLQIDVDGAGIRYRTVQSVQSVGHRVQVLGCGGPKIFWKTGSLNDAPMFGDKGSSISGNPV